MTTVPLLDDITCRVITDQIVIINTHVVCISADASSVDVDIVILIYILVFSDKERCGEY